MWYVEKVLWTLQIRHLAFVAERLLCRAATQRSRVHFQGREKFCMAYIYYSREFRCNLWLSDCVSPWHPQCWVCLIGVISVCVIKKRKGIMPSKTCLKNYWVNYIIYIKKYCCNEFYFYGMRRHSSPMALSGWVSDSGSRNTGRYVPLTAFYICAAPSS